MYGYFTEREDGKSGHYTDLAIERRRADIEAEGIEFKKEISIGGVWERLRIKSDAAAKDVGRPIGYYDTLNTARMDLLDSESISDAQGEIARELCYIFDLSDIFPGRILVAGLGNPSLAPDAVGVKCAGAVKPTMHIKDFDLPFFGVLGCSEIAVCTPGINASSGMDASVTVRALCKELSPDGVIVIDSLASRSAKRLGSTVQISNTGITPGSGLGNSREPINKDTVGVPVIAIGVPTVIDARYFKAEHENIPMHTQGTMFVSPKEINDIVDAAALIIGGGINQAFGI